MADITLKLDPEALQAATVQAIVGVLTPEAIIGLLDQAVKALLAPSTGSFDNRKTPLEIAFNQAVNKVAAQEAHKLVEEDEAIRTRLKELLRATADKVLNTDVDKMSDRMSDAFVASMRKEY